MSDFHTRCDALESELDSLLSPEELARIRASEATPLALFDTDEGGAPFTLGQFRLSNIEAPEVDEWVATMSALGVGDAFTVGGGAGAETTIRRVR